MTSLPPALAAWAEPLSLFPPELALSLGPCIRRLAQAMGPLSRPAEELSEDPNGYEGLSRRGSYERLLISEWLLADEAPDEFLRRAAQREHAFLALSFHRPGGSRRSLALFDAGPELIGEPRIGQLAALVVLSQRARRGGAAFGWGVLQDETRQVSSEVTPASVLRLLFSRTVRTARPEDAEAWSQVGGAPLEADDLWVVGGPRTVPAGGAAASRLELEDPLELRRRDLLATVRRKGAAPQPLELPLPEAADCVRLLRDPFSARRAPAVVQPPRPPANGIAFAQNGRRILVRHRDGSVSAHPVPNSPRMSPGLARTFELKPGETLIAAGWMRGARVVLVQDEMGFTLHGLQRRADPVTYWLEGREWPSPGTAPAPLPALLYVPGRAVGEKGPHLVHVVLDAEGHLFALGGGPDRVMRLVASDVLACAERDGALHVIRGSRTRTGYVLLHNVDGKDVGMTDGMPGLHAFISGDSSWIAVEKRPDEWDVFTASPRVRRYAMSVPGSEVFGLTVQEKLGAEPAFLVIERDRRSVSLLGRAGAVSLIRVASPIVHAVASGRGSEIAMLGADGTVTVMSLAHLGKVLELKPPPQPEPSVRIDLASRRDEEAP